MGSGNSKINSSSAPLSSGISANLSSYFNVVPYSTALTSYKKYALIIGINYTGTSIALNGCINDALNMDKLLKEWGFETTVMTDNQTGALIPTKNNIISQITAHINKINTNDVLVIYYSGHGALIPDTSGDEISGKDSVIVPMNVQTQGFINDDYIRSLLNNAVAGSKVLGIFDCCNSGSVCDLRYNYFDTSYRSNPGDKNSQIIQRTNTITNNNYTETSASVLSLSGCKDDQLSYETVVDNGKAGGALTYCLLKHIYENTPNITVEQLLLQVRGMLKSYGFNQVPSLMSGKLIEPTNLNLASFLNI